MVLPPRSAAMIPQKIIVSQELKKNIPAAGRPNIVSLLTYTLFIIETVIMIMLHSSLWDVKLKNQSMIKSHCFNVSMVTNLEKDVVTA
jgi:hypothetical protein